MMAEAVKRKNRYESYGSVAYAPAYAPQRERDGQAGTQGRPLVRPRERVEARPRALVRPAGRVSIFAVVGFLAVFVFAGLLLMSYVQLAVVGDGVVAARTQLSQLQEENAKLLTQYELAYDLKAVEQQVTASGAMSKPQSGQSVVLDLSEADSVLRYDQQPETTGVKDVFAGIKDAVGNIVAYFR